MEWQWKRDDGFVLSAWHWVALWLTTMMLVSSCGGEFDLKKDPGWKSTFCKEPWVRTTKEIEECNNY